MQSGYLLNVSFLAAAGNSGHCQRAGALRPFNLPGSMMSSIDSIINGRYRVTFVIDAQPNMRLLRARDEQAQRSVLIAELPVLAAVAPDQLAAAQATLADFDHPALLRLHDMPAGAAGPLLIFNDPGGQDLGRLLSQRSAALIESQALVQFDRLLGALHQVHEAGLRFAQLRTTDIWTDLPGSMYLAPYAALRDYPAPAAAVDADLYAFAGLLYQLLTGRAPPTIAERRAGMPLHAPHTLNAQISLSVEQVLLKALALEAGQPYQSAAELRAALAEAQQPPAAAVPAAPPQPDPAPATPAAADPQTLPARENNTCLFALVAALALIALAICVVSLYLTWLLFSGGTF
jgi:eukaryotic-like serine/threonine-protein kinase